MLPQFGYVVAQAGADSRASSVQSIYSPTAAAAAAKTTATAPSPPPALQQVAHASYTANNTSSHVQQQQQRHQTNAYQPHPAVPSSHPQQPLYPAYSATGSHPSWMYTTSAPIHGSSIKTEYHTQYYSSNYDRGYTVAAAPTTLTAPPPPPPPLPPSPPAAKAAPKLPPSSIWRKKAMSPMVEHVKPPPTSRWHQEDPFELNDSRMIRRLRDCNDVMAWMDHDFKEQRDEMYHEKRLALQNELKCIQEGVHAVFQEQVADLEVERDQTIASAECFETYQQTMANQDLEVDRMVIEEEYKDEMRHLNDTIMLVLEDYRKQIKDDRGDVELDGLFDQVLDRLQQKKQFRKRTTVMINGGGGGGIGGGGNGGGTMRQETSSRGRRLKNATVTPHNINAPMSLQEEEDVEAEYLDMKDGITKRNTTISRR